MSILFEGQVVRVTGAGQGTLTPQHVERCATAQTPYRQPNTIR